jgi:hypothetical protein
VRNRVLSRASKFPITPKFCPICGQGIDRPLTYQVVLNLNTPADTVITLFPNLRGKKSTYQHNREAWQPTGCLPRLPNPPKKNGCDAACSRRFKRGEHELCKRTQGQGDEFRDDATALFSARKEAGPEV